MKNFIESVKAEISLAKSVDTRKDLRQKMTDLGRQLAQSRLPWQWRSIMNEAYDLGHEDPGLVRDFWFGYNYEHDPEDYQRNWYERELVRS